MGLAPPASSRPIRVQRKRTKGWRMPPNTVSVARPSKFGNPHRVGYCPVCGITHTQEEAVEEFRAMLKDIIWSDEFTKLKGKNLACFCPVGEPCHADVLLEFVNS